MSYAHYHLIQIVLDHGLPEPKSIGVLVHQYGHAELRMIGSLQGRTPYDDIDRWLIHFAVPEVANHEWVFEQWVDWFRRIAAEFETNRKVCLTFLRRLKARGEPVIASIEGDEVIDTGETLADVADRLFDEVVGRKPAFKRARFHAKVREKLGMSELHAFDGFNENAEIEVLGPDGNVSCLLHFPHFWDSQRSGRLAVKLISFDASPEEISAAVADTSNTFDAAVRQGDLPADRCIVLHDQPGTSNAAYVSLLGARFRLIDVTSDDASAEFRAILIPR